MRRAISARRWLRTAIALIAPLAWLASGLSLTARPVAAGETAPTSPPGEIRFEASNAMSTADGTFHRWRVTKAEIDPGDLTSGFVEVEVDVASVDTDIERRDNHLRTADFFEVERWPTASVRVHGAKRNGSDDAGRTRYSARFDLHIRDQSKTVDGEFSVIEGSPLRVEGSLEIDRMDFGVGDPESRWNPMSITQRVPIRFRLTLPQ